MLLVGLIWRRNFADGIVSTCRSPSAPLRSFACVTAHTCELPTNSSSLVHICLEKLFAAACNTMTAHEMCWLCEQATAQLYNALGLPEYEAMEAFVEYDVHHPSPLFRAGRATAAEPARE